MKSIVSVIALALLALPISAQNLKDTAQVPDELVTLRASYDREIQRVTANTNAAYLAALKKQQDAFTRQAKLPEALAIGNEITRIEKLASDRPDTSKQTVRITDNQLEKRVVGVWIAQEPQADGSNKQIIVQVYDNGRGNYGGKAVGWKIEKKQLLFTDVSDTRSKSWFTFDENLETFHGVGFNRTTITGKRR